IEVILHHLKVSPGGAAISARRASITVERRCMAPPDTWTKCRMREEFQSLTRAGKSAESTESVESVESAESGTLCGLDRLDRLDRLGRLNLEWSHPRFGEPRFRESRNARIHFSFRRSLEV